MDPLIEEGGAVMSGGRNERKVFWRTIVKLSWLPVTIAICFLIDKTWWRPVIGIGMLLGLLLLGWALTALTVGIAIALLTWKNPIKEWGLTKLLILSLPISVIDLWLRREGVKFPLTWLLFGSLVLGILWRGLKRFLLF